MMPNRKNVELTKPLSSEQGVVQKERHQEIKESELPEGAIESGYEDQVAAEAQAFLNEKWAGLSVEDQISTGANTGALEMLAGQPDSAEDMYDGAVSGETGEALAKALAETKGEAVVETTPEGVATEDLEAQPAKATAEELAATEVEVSPVEVDQVRHAAIQALGEIYQELDKQDRRTAVAANMTLTEISNGAISENKAHAVGRLLQERAHRLEAQNTGLQEQIDDLVRERTAAFRKHQAEQEITPATAEHLQGTPPDLADIIEMEQADDQWAATAAEFSARESELQVQIETNTAESESLNALSNEVELLTKAEGVLPIEEVTDEAESKEAELGEEDAEVGEETQMDDEEVGETEESEQRKEDEDAEVDPEEGEGFEEETEEAEPSSEALAAAVFEQAKNLEEMSIPELEAELELAAKFNELVDQQLARLEGAIDTIDSLLEKVDAEKTPELAVEYHAQKVEYEQQKQMLEAAKLMVEAYAEQVETVLAEKKGEQTVEMDLEKLMRQFNDFFADNPEVGQQMAAESRKQKMSFLEMILTVLFQIGQQKQG